MKTSVPIYLEERDGEVLMAELASAVPQIQN